MAGMTFPADVIQKVLHLLGISDEGTTAQVADMSAGALAAGIATKTATPETIKETGIDFAAVIKTAITDAMTEYAAQTAAQVKAVSDGLAATNARIESVEKTLGPVQERGVRIDKTMGEIKLLLSESAKIGGGATKVEGHEASGAAAAIEKTERQVEAPSAGKIKLSPVGTPMFQRGAAL